MNAHDDFAAALQAGELLQPLPGLDLTQAYRIAAHRHALRLATGDRPIGRKIGHTNTATWAAQGIAAPSWGWLAVGVAYLPLIGLALYLGAGAPERPNLGRA